MESDSPYFDLAIIETLNGGDLQVVGQDLAIVRGNENQFYLAMFGGNVAQNTEPVTTLAESNDWWGNDLLFKNQPALQFNSNTERTLNTTELNSTGRVTIENAIKTDLKFLKLVGAVIDVTVTIPSDNLVTVQITAKFNSGQTGIIIINYKKKSNGDFFAMDFNADFFI